MENEKPVIDRKTKILYSIIGVLFIWVLILSSYTIREINSIDNWVGDIGSDTIPKSGFLDFQNPTGAIRIQSSFTDLVITSEGSRQRDNGYELSLNIINTASTGFKEVKAVFTKGDKSATCNDLNFFLYSGRSRVLKCFFSDLSKEDLSSIEVSVVFDKIYY